jgi:hypothetical protein
MNWISGARKSAGRGKVPRKSSSGAIVVALLAAAVLAGRAHGQPDAEPAPGRYDVRYAVRLDPAAGNAKVSMRVRQPRALLRELRMPAAGRLGDFRGDGLIDEIDGFVVWEPPASGGALEWTASVAHRRNGDGYDAWLGPEWGIFRAEDVIPRAATRTLRNAQSRTRFSFELPRGWSVITQYPQEQSGFTVDNPARRFDQPSGWILAGKIGVRRDSIAGVGVAVAGPVGQSVRRMDTLALLNWTLPELARLLPVMPERLTVISAGDPMWRGGLSAPQSLYVHADRPLISENATSTLLHEVMHMALGLRAKPGSDWIVEGLAEFYSLELLRRSGTITAPRYRRARAEQAEWAKAADSLCTNRSGGATTALAVTVLAALDTELRESSGGTITLDDATRDLAHRGPVVGIADLRASVERLAGQKPDSLHIDKLPGCRNIRPQTD